MKKRKLSFNEFGKRLSKLLTYDGIAKEEQIKSLIDFLKTYEYY